MVIFHSYVSLPEGKPPFSYGFPMVFPLKPPFSYGKPTFPSWVASPQALADSALVKRSNKLRAALQERGLKGHFVPMEIWKMIGK